jgi:hypothetical protein
MPDPKTIDPSKVLWLILTWPDNMIPAELALWLVRSKVDAVNVVTYCERAQAGIDVVRCKAYEKVIRPQLDKYEWIAFSDNDTRPTSATDLWWLDRTADVVAANYECGRPEAMADPEAFHMGLVRVRTEMLKKLDAKAAEDKQPHWAFPKKELNLGIQACECAWFGQRLKDVGATVVRAGWFEHRK